MTRRVDAHVHLWSRASDPQDWIDPVTMGVIDRDFGPSDLERMLEGTTMDTAVVVQASNSLDESIRLSQLESAAIGGLVAWVDLTGDVVAQLDRLRADASVAVVGVRHLAHIDPDPEWLLRDDVARGLAVLGREGLPFDLVVRDWQLGQASRVASHYEGVRFVLDHLGGPPGPGFGLDAWQVALVAVAEQQNVVAKLSGLISGLAPLSWQAADLQLHVDTALDAFGPGRLLYGSDWPLADLGGGAGAWRAALDTLLANLSGNERAAVFGGSAVEVYSLE
jgi:L-fuconolactonase